MPRLAACFLLLLASGLLAAPAPALAVTLFAAGLVAGGYYVAKG